MRSTPNCFIRCVQALTLLMLSLCAPSLWAGCSFTSGTDVGKLIFTLPTLSVPQDTAVGTVLYSGQVTSANVIVKCTSTAGITQGYKALSASDYVSNNPLVGVYATNVPGIGIRATWVNSGAATFDNGSYIKPFGPGTSKVESMSYNMTFNARVELVVTGPISSGTLIKDNLTAVWKYDNLTVATLGYTGADINVTGTSCDLVEKDITVELRPIHPDDFVFNAATGVTNDPFYIQLTRCNKDITVDIKFSGSGSSGLIDNYTLATIPSANAAQGVGIQIVGANLNIVEFNKSYPLSTKTMEGDSLRIPFTARYVKTGNVTPGEVTAIATFEVYYR